MSSSSVCAATLSLVPRLSSRPGCAGELLDCARSAGLNVRLGCPALPEPGTPIAPEACRLLWQAALLYESGSAMLDASYYSQMMLPLSLLTDAGCDLGSFVRLRISNFGSLATGYDDDTMAQEWALV